MHRLRHLDQIFTKSIFVNNLSHEAISSRRAGARVERRVRSKGEGGVWDPDFASVGPKEKLSNDTENENENAPGRRKRNENDFTELTNEWRKELRSMWRGCWISLLEQFQEIEKLHPSWCLHVSIDTYESWQKLARHRDSYRQMDGQTCRWGRARKGKICC